MKKLEIGDMAPDFESKDQNGDSISLSTYRGKKVILYFYPKDNTPGCTVESCNFRDNYESLLSQGYEVIGVSADSEKSHLKFIEKHSLPFPLVADTEKVVLEKYNAWGLKKFMGREFMGILRKTFIIDEEGKIEHIIEKVKTKEATKQVLDLMNN